MTRIRGPQNKMRLQCAPNQVNQMIRHPCTTFGAVVVSVNKRSVTPDARTFIPHYLLGGGNAQSEVKSQRYSNNNLLVNSHWPDN